VLETTGAIHIQHHAIRAQRPSEGGGFMAQFIISDAHPSFIFLHAQLATK
jgi:hypothetical protein